MRGTLPRPAMSPPEAVTGATRVCELAAASRAAFWLLGTTAAPLRDSTGAWSSSLTLEQAERAAAAARTRRYRWLVLIASFLCFEMRSLSKKTAVVNARKGPTPARADQPSQTAGEP